MQIFRFQLITTYHDLLANVFVLPEPLKGGGVVHQLVCPLLTEPYRTLEYFNNISVTYYYLYPGIYKYYYYYYYYYLAPARSVVACHFLRLLYHSFLEALMKLS